MNSTIKPSAVSTSAPTFTAAERKAITDAKTEIARLDSRLDEVTNLRETLATVATDFAAGKIDILAAAALATANAEQRNEIATALRAPIKLAMKAVIESARPLLEKCRRHCIDELAAKCQTMENAERENASAIGIGDDDYRPSGMLESLREQHRRALAAVNDQPTKGELMAL